MEEFKIDRNQIIGFVLIGVIMLLFAWWNAENAPVNTSPNQTTNTTTVVEDSSKTAAAITETPIAEAVLDTGAVASIKDTFFTIENDLIKLTISGQGALLTKAELKKYHTWDTLPLMLIDSNMLMAVRVGTLGSSITGVYSGTTQRNDSSTTLALQHTNENGQTFAVTYTLPDSSYQVQLNVQGEGFGSAANDLYLDWQLDGLRTEKSIDMERQTSTIYYWQEDDYDYLSVRGEDDETLENLKWIGYKQQFFSSILEPTLPIKSSRMAIAPFEDADLVKRFKSENNFGPVTGAFNLSYNLYLGPNKYEILKSYGSDYSDIIDFGWGIFGWIGKGVVIPIFNWLEDYGINYGIIILIMAIIIKLVLFPLTYQSYKSMAKMRVLKPEMDELNEKFKDKDPVKKNQAVMELYQQAGVNPLGGCIPMLVQMPILIAMFRFFPASFELRQQPFLWAKDLSTYDAIFSWQAQIPLLSDIYGNHISLFTILMTISTLVYTWLNSQMQGNTNQIPGMKYIMYGMPVMLLFWFNSYSAGLSYYYFVANVITFTQQFIIRRTMNEDAIHAKIQAKRSGPKKKKSKFAQRLEEVQKAQAGKKGR